MDKWKFGLLSGLIVSLLIGCKKEEDVYSEIEYYNESGATISEYEYSGETYHFISGNITEGFTMTSDKKWVLDGEVNVLDGGHLYIKPGTVIYGNVTSSMSYLGIQQGGQISAIGSSASPIKFASFNEVVGTPKAGDWGGIVINGRAPINAPGGICPGKGGTGQFGGDDANDGSGTLKYVIVKNAGRTSDDGYEMNNITLNGVGSSTTIDYIQALDGLDDGIEIFGGTVNISHAISKGNQDDGFDWTMGWQGYGQFWLAIQEQGIPTDRAIEGGSCESNFMSSPISYPTISNITIIGYDDGDGLNAGIALRNGTKASIYNAIITGFPWAGISLRDYSQVYAGKDVTISNSTIFNNGTNFHDTKDLESGFNNSTNPIVLTDFIGSNSGGIDLSLTSEWFEETHYQGAIPADNDWTGFAESI